MTTRTEHTPGLGNLVRKGAAIMSGCEVVALACHDWITADEMVRRCNAHDDLVAACEAARAVLAGALVPGSLREEVFLQLKAALAKAKA